MHFTAVASVLANNVSFPSPTISLRSSPTNKCNRCKLKFSIATKIVRVRETLGKTSTNLCFDGTHSKSRLKIARWCYCTQISAFGRISAVSSATWRARCARTMRQISAWCRVANCQFTSSRMPTHGPPTHPSIHPFPHPSY